MGPIFSGLAVSGGTVLGGGGGRGGRRGEGEDW